MEDDDGDDRAPVPQRQGEQDRGQDRAGDVAEQPLHTAVHRDVIADALHRGHGTHEGPHRMFEAQRHRDGRTQRPRDGDAHTPREQGPVRGAAQGDPDRLPPGHAGLGHAVCAGEPVARQPVQPRRQRGKHADQRSPSRHRDRKNHIAGILGEDLRARGAEHEHHRAGADDVQRPHQVRRGAGQDGNHRGHEEYVAAGGAQDRADADRRGDARPQDGKAAGAHRVRVRAAERGDQSAQRRESGHGVLARHPTDDEHHRDRDTDPQRHGQTGPPEVDIEDAAQTARRDGMPQRGETVAEVASESRREHWAILYHYFTNEVNRAILAA